MARTRTAPVLAVGDRVHYEGYPEDQGVVRGTQTVKKYANGQGGGMQSSAGSPSLVDVTMYQVEWSSGLDLHQRSELVKIG